MPSSWRILSRVIDPGNWIDAGAPADPFDLKLEMMEGTPLEFRHVGKRGWKRVKRTTGETERKARKRWDRLEKERMTGKSE